MGEASKGFKVEPPEKFDGKRSELRSFLTHAKLYLTFKEHLFPNEAKKVLAVAAFLKGQAFEWFEPRMRDYLENDAEDRESATDELFATYDNFAKELESVFGEVDEKRSAERELRMLKQTTSAKQYATEFRRITAKLNRDEESLLSDFYAGLKPFLKTEFALHELDDLQDMISKAVKLDSRMYEAHLENRGSWKATGYGSNYNSYGQGNNQANSGRRREPGNNRHNSGKWGSRNSRDPDAMEIDAVNRRPMNKQQQEWMKQGRCLGCGSPDHFNKDCDKCKKRQVGMVHKEPPNQYSQDPGHRDHGNSNQDQGDLDHVAEHWSFCYQDSCLVHLSGKEDARWFLKKPRKKGRG
jgi:hypothetical protein